MDNKLELMRSGIVISLRCTLKCKLCGGYAPYYEQPPHFSHAEISRTMENYFKVIDYVGDFSITGGEPLMHKELAQIMTGTLTHEKKIGRILILTNGTLLFSDDVLDVLESHDKFHVTISDYGDLSPKVDEVIGQLSERNISYRVINYSGIDIFCDGWVDYGDHTKRHFTQDEIDKKGRDCAIRSRKVSIIVGGELHSCGRSLRRMELGIIPKNKNEYVDLNDENESLENKRDRVRKMYDSVSITSCAYCNGLCEDSKRYPPAEQLG